MRNVALLLVQGSNARDDLHKAERLINFNRPGSSSVSSWCLSGQANIVSMKTASGLAASLACALLLMCNALAAESTHAMRGTRSLAAKGPSGSKLKMLINCFAP